ncbi:penicillin-binding protein 2 [Rhodococcus aerolatus]
MGADPARRRRWGRGVIFLALAVAVVQLVRVQGIDAAELSAAAQEKRSLTTTQPATRGAVLDRNGTTLAFTLEAKALTFQPTVVRAELAAAHDANPGTAPTVDQRLDAIAQGVHDRLGDAVPAATVRAQLAADTTFVYLARQVDPATASAISDEFPEVGTERQGVREYPGGSLAANLVGTTGWDGHGLLGLESSLDSELAGTDGTRTVERGADGAVIPGSTRDEHPATDGSTVTLTIDADVQWYVQQAVQRAKDNSLAQDASVVVLDAHTGQVVAMANDGTFDPSRDTSTASAAAMGNNAVTTPFEPGSVNKIITAAAAIEDGITTPTQVHQVDGQIQVADRTVRDAWSHGVVPMTTTGIFGKSSNVGTLGLAQQVGEDRYADMLTKFGLGRRTDVGLPGESAGSVPSRDQWSGSTFANLPIGQGLSMTLLQMTGMYQAIANGGVRVPPRIVASTTAPDGTVTPTPQPEGVQVVSPQTADTVKDMFRAIVQDAPGQDRGTGVAAGIPGYQVSGKTGTAQQVDESCGCYSNSKYWITFAGMAPADDPRYVVGIMLDAPQRGVDGGGGQSAAPLFHDIASWLLQRQDVPLSPQPTPFMPLVADQ